MELIESEKSNTKYIISVVIIILVFSISIYLYSIFDLFFFLIISAISLSSGILLGFYSIFEKTRYFTEYQGDYPEKRDLNKIKQKYQMRRIGIILVAIVYPIFLYFLFFKMVDVESLDDEIYVTFISILVIIPLILGFIGHKIIQLIYPQRIEDNFLRYQEGLRYSEYKLGKKKE